MSYIQAKIVIPKERKRLLHRERLVNFLHAHIDRKLIMISASAGYGKTSLLVDFAGDSDLPVCWYAPDEQDRNLRDFVEYFCAAIEQVFPGRLPETRRILNQQISDLRAETLAGLVVNDILQNIPDFFVMILDDYHVVDDIVAINLFLDTFLRYEPENCRLIIASRVIPTLTPRGMALLVAGQQIAGLGVRDLQFTAHEVRDLIQKNYGRELSLEQAEALTRDSEGWITAILMQWQPIWSGLLGSLPQTRGGTAGVYEFLANEVFQHLPAERRAFLQDTSILSLMSVGLCDAILERTDSRDILEGLLDQNLFITRLERDGQVWYQYHRLFREFLAAKLRAGSSGQQIALHLRAARYLEGAGEPADAIHHFLEAGLYQDAGRLILQEAAGVYDAGRRDALLAWIDALPDDMLDRMPRLHWFKSKILWTRGDFAGALAYSERARAGFDLLQDRVSVAQALVEKATSLLVLGRFSDVLDACNIAFASLHGLELHGRQLGVLGSVYRYMGLSHFRTGLITESIEELRQSLELYERSGYTTSLALVHNDLGSVLRAAGNLAGSQYHFEQALKICEGDGNLSGAVNAMNSLGFTQHLRGQYQDALTMYALALKKARDIAEDRLSAFILAGIGDSHIACGETDKAIEAYEEGAALWPSDAYLQDYLRGALATAHLMQGNPQKALDLARQAFERAQERGARQEAATYEIVLGTVYYQQGYSRRATEYLHRAAETLQASRAYRDLARAQVHLAQAQYHAGRVDQAQVTLDDLTETILELGQDQFLLHEAQWALPVLEYGCARGIGGAILAGLLERTRAHKARLSQRAPSIVPPKGVESANMPPIRVFALGETRVMRGGETVTPKEWAAVKARQLFFYLLSNPGQRREQISEIFWPESGEEKARGAFHITTYRLRRAMGQSEVLVVDDEDKYQINRQAPIWYDVREFQRLVDEANQMEKRAPAQAADRRREAIELVRGQFCEDLPDMDWMRETRLHLEQQFLEALVKLGDFTLSRGAPADALGYFRRAIVRDDLREDAHRGIMRSLAAAGDRVGALKHYRQVEELIRQEMGTTPDAETVRLYQQIAAGRDANAPSR